MESIESGNPTMKNLFSLEGRVALVTGGGGGRGQMMGERFIAHRARGDI
jgi:hypothetical protein